MCHGFAVCSRGLRLQGVEALLPFKASQAQHVDGVDCGAQTMLAHRNTVGFCSIFSL